MKEYLTVNEISMLWGVKPSQVTRYCRDGRIDGIIKERGIWMIPSHSEKPGYGKKSIQEPAAVYGTTRKALPVGISSYKEACKDYYYIDKTMLIKDFLDERPKVSLFTRPRRFGKTLSMDMLRVFFEKTEEDTSIYFRDKQIWNQGSFYTSHQGKYPVVYLSFKDAKKNTWLQTRDHLVQLITSEFRRHTELVHSDRILNSTYYQHILKGSVDPDQFDVSLKELTQMLHEHHGVAPIVIIDEYDTPIQQGYSKGFYDEIVDFMRNLFSGALKDNEHLSFGFLTGILRVARESIFSGLNNLRIYSILDQRFSRYFGFTKEEVLEMARYYRSLNRYQEVCDWYDGYRFGQAEIFNPWSVINYFSNDCHPSPFWENTGSNEIIGEILEKADPEVYSQLNTLLEGKEIATIIDTNVIYPEIKHNPSSIYSFLLMAGYLKISKKEMTVSGDLICSVAIPNREIAYVYKKEVVDRVGALMQPSIPLGIQEALYLGNIEKFQGKLQQYLLESVSAFDLINENSYHMLLLGLCAMMSDHYYLTSNRESGKGRFDIQLLPKVSSFPGILIEIKHEKSLTTDELESLAEKALKQIEEKCYDADLKNHPISSILKYGVAFSGKNVAVKIQS